MQRKQTAKICQICGKEFYSSSPHAKFCSLYHKTNCCECGAEIEYHYSKRDMKDKMKCKKCSQKQRMETQKANNGGRLGFNKMREKTCEICGEPYMTSSSYRKYCDKCKTLVATTTCELCGKEFEYRVTKYKPGTCEECRPQMRSLAVLRKYGVKNAMQLDEVKERSQATQRARYSGKLGFNTEKQRQTMIKLYGVDHCWKIPEVREKCLKAKANSNYGSHISTFNESFHERLKNEGIKSCYEYYLHPYSYDLKIDEKNILVEINPTISHNCYWDPWRHKGISPDYHYKKTKYAREHGFICINVWSWSDEDEVIELIKNIDEYDISQTDSSSLFWSDKNGSGVVRDSSIIDRDEMISKGWYPVYDDGQIIRRKEASL